jgi:SnoaL-like protein
MSIKTFFEGRGPVAVVSATAALTAAMILTAQTPSFAAGRSVEERIQALQGEQQIRELLEEYGHRFDTLDLAGYSQLFSARGTWNGNFGGSYVTATGPAEVLAMMTRVLGKPRYDARKVAGFHLMTNFLIRVEGEHATSFSRWTYFIRDEDNKLTPSLAGHYEDKLIHEHGQWKFLERRVFKDIPTDN